MAEGSLFYTNFLSNISRESLLERKPQETAWRGLASFVLLLLSMRNTNKKILIVDGDDRFRESLRVFITGLGHQVFEAATGLEAIDKACSIRPDLIMIDLRLPGMYGDEVTARLKANKSTRNIPVVINTGWTTACNIEQRVERALNAGAEEILYKPFQLPVLRDILRTYLLA
jgi:CheY-like chemotaxis protein